MCPLLLTAVGYFPKFVQEELSAGESHGRGNREKACLIMLYFPFFKSKKHSLGKFREYYAIFPASPGKGINFLHCLCVTWHCCRGTCGLEHEAAADTEAVMWERDVAPISFLCHGMPCLCTAHLWMEASLADLMPMENSAQ